MSVDWYEASRNGHIFWKGVRTLKHPVDLWSYQQIIWDTKPDVVLETGTYHGGSALYFADLGVEVHTVDIAAAKAPPAYPNITYHHGPSTHPRILYQLTQAVQGKRVMVVLDSDHSRIHVLDELTHYGPLVSSGCYLVVEDTPFGRTVCVGEPHYEDGGPADALDDWLPGHPEFMVDDTREIWGLSMHPGGFLLRQ